MKVMLTEDRSGVGEQAWKDQDGKTALDAFARIHLLFTFLVSQVFVLMLSGKIGMGGCQLVKVCF